MEPAAPDLSEALATPAGIILLVGFDSALAQQLAQNHSLDAEVRVSANEAEALAKVTAGEVAVLCLGDQLSGERAKLFLERALGYPEADQEEAAPTPQTPLSVNVVFAAGPDLDLFADFIAQDHLYYLSQSLPQSQALLEILGSALAQHRATHSPYHLKTSGLGHAADAQRILKLLQRLSAEPNERRITRLMADAAAEIAQGDRAFCLLYDREGDVLWTPQEDGAEDRRESAAAGLVSFVLRTGTPILLPRIGQDPRYEPEADNDSGAKDERFLALPISDKNGRSIAVLVVLRRGSRDPFGTAEQRLLATMVEHAAPFVGKFALERELDAMVTQKHGALGSQAADIFRREALVHHSQGLGDRGNVLELSPAWTRLSYKLLLAVFVGGLIYSVLGSIYEYASGVAVIRVSDRTDVTSTIAGTTIEVEVSSGQTVAKGQLLARFYGARELANLTRIRHEFEVALAQRLRNPSDLAAERNLSSLRAQREQAEAELEERSVRAPRSGIISDLRIRPGQHLVPGDMILSLVDENPTLEVLAIFPGQYRPQIKHGMKIRLELTGYRYAYQHLQVEDVTQEVVGPSEARRMLGPGIGDAVALSGPVVFVRATLPMDHFESDGKSYRYHDGMQGLAEVRIRRERILTTLIPGLKSAFSNRHG